MSAKGGNVVPGVAGCIGISGKLCCDPGGTVVYEDTFKYGHLVWTDLVVEVQSSVDEEVKENVPDCGLIGGDVFNQGWIEGAVVPWVNSRLGGVDGSVLVSSRLRAILWMRFIYREYPSLTSARQLLRVVGDTQPKIAR